MCTHTVKVILISLMVVYFRSIHTCTFTLLTCFIVKRLLTITVELRLSSVGSVHVVQAYSGTVKL